MLVSLPVRDLCKRSGYREDVDSGARSLSKPERQRLIASVIGRRRVGTQLELVQALAEAGCSVTQATLSRDLRELRIGKIEDELGLPRYVLPERPAGSDPVAGLAAILARFGRGIVAAQNIVVIRSELGSAPAIARALDRVRHPLVVGTLAGDDTCLVVAASAEDALALVRELG
jgi:transcriptional regulator of arginine metabolism